MITTGGYWNQKLLPSLHICGLSDFQVKVLDERVASTHFGGRDHDPHCCMSPARRQTRAERRKLLSNRLTFNMMWILLDFPYREVLVVVKGNILEGSVFIRHLWAVTSSLLSLINRVPVPEAEVLFDHPTIISVQALEFLHREAHMPKWINELNHLCNWEGEWKKSWYGVNMWAYLFVKVVRLWPWYFLIAITV